MAGAAVAEAARRGFEVVRASAVRGMAGRVVWVQVLREVGGPDELAARLLADAGPLDVDDVARRLVSGGPRLIVVDDLDHGGRSALEVLSAVAGRVAAGRTAVVVTSGTPLGVGREVTLGGLTEADLLSVVGPVRPGAGHALWVASRGLPGVARSLAETLAGLGEDEDPLVWLALHAVSRTGFLDVDVSLLRLLELALSRAGDGAVRARLLARLARELVGDASAGSRRRALVDEAWGLAHRAGDHQTLAEVLDARLHALWDAGAARDRLAAGAEIVVLARQAGDERRERHGLFWRFVALMELGRVGEAESALAAFERSARVAGDEQALVVATARHGMLASLRGRFDEVWRIAEEVAEAGRRVGLADTDRLVATLRYPVAEARGDGAAASVVLDVALGLARRFPGHYYEATAARILVSLRREPDAAAELERVLPRVLAGSGPRWVGALADLTLVAIATANTSAAADLYRALAPLRGRLVVWGAANTTTGPVSHYLGLLAHHLNRPDEAIDHLTDALALEEQIGALPHTAHTLAALAEALTNRNGDGDAQQAATCRHRARAIAERLAMTPLLERLTRPGDEWTLRRDDDDWILEAGPERARLRDSRGLHYLRMLLAAPGTEVAVEDMAAGGAGLRGTTAGPVLDETARAAYRARLESLAHELNAADRSGDRDRASTAQAEHDAVLAELRRSAGLGGRTRMISPDTERARVNVTRTLRATLDRITSAAPRAGAHLSASIRTGRACRYQPAPGGPTRWHV